MTLSDVAIRRPVFTTMIALAMMVLGGIGYRFLGVDLFPDISFPVVVINVPYPGASPEEVEQLVTKPIEDAVASINGVDILKSFSRDSFGTVVIMFKMETDVKMAAVDVRDKIASIRRNLPADIDEPIISRVDPSQQAIITYTVRSNQSAYETRKIVDDLVKPALEQVPGVGSVLVQGGEVREIQINLDGSKLLALGLTPTAVTRLLAAQNLNVPAGRLDDGRTEISVRTMGQFRSVDEIANAPLLSMNGSTIRVQDIGTVVDGFEEKRLITRTDGVESVSLGIQKNSGENTVAVVERIKTRLAKLEKELPEGIVFTEILDQSVFIKSNAASVEEHIVFGGLMAILIIFIFMLDWRSTLITSLALPTSVVMTFFVMYLMDFTLNMMSLLGLSLAIGILIDDAVVVRENIFRHLEMGKDPVTAASDGTSEIALAVLATSATVIAVFVPVAFMKGMVGQFFKQFGITVAAAVAVSTFVAFTIDPMLSARLVKKVKPGDHERAMQHWFFGRFHRGFQALDDSYRRILEWSLAHKFTVVGVATAMFFGSLFVAGIMGKEFAPVEDRGQFTVFLELPADASLQETDAVTRKAETLIQRNKDIVHLYSLVGSPSESGTTLEANKATIRVLATDKSERDATFQDLKDDVRKRLASLAGVRFTVADPAFVEGATEAPIQLYVRGQDYDRLADITGQLTASLQKVAGIRDVTSSFVPGKPEYQVRINRDSAAALGVNIAEVGMSLRAAVEGDTTNKLRVGEDEYDVRVRLSPEQRNNAMLLANLSVPSSQGRSVKVNEFAEIVPGSGPATVERENRQRQISLGVYIGDRSLGDIVNDVNAIIAGMELPAGYQIVIGGMAERMAESFENLGLALLLAVIFIYFVLASQFESFIHPFTIMIALPLAIVGAFVTLFLAGQNLGMAAMIGVILLMGLVTKNSILLIDYTIQLQDRGMGVVEALMEAGPTRLRPILMTSAAIVLGMLPTAVLDAPGSEFRSPMAVAVIGGVITSTFLSLVVVPVVYIWMDRFTIKKKVDTSEIGHHHDTHHPHHPAESV